MRSRYALPGLQYRKSARHVALAGPRLAGLSYEYLSAQMRAFADGQRTNNEDMPKIMKDVSESDLEAMARYLAGL